MCIRDRPWRWLTLGLAGAAIVVAGLAAGLLWSRATAPSAGGGAGSASSGAPATAAPLPVGYHWYTRPAATAGKARGFVLAVPAGWQPRQRGTATYLWNPASGAIISVSPAPGAGQPPVREERRVAVHLPAARHGHGGWAGGGDAGQRRGRRVI